MSDDNDQPSFVDGNCYCGRVQFRVRIKPEPKTLGVYCHCDSCRRAHAAPCYQVVYLPQECFTITAGQDLVQPCQRPGQHIIRSFCRSCGSRVTNTFDPPRANLGVGIFPALLSDDVQHHLPVCLRPQYHHLAEDAVFDLTRFHDGLPRRKPSVLVQSDAPNTGDCGLITVAAIEAAARVVSASQHVRRTPLLTGIPVRDGVDVVLKLENCQVTGSFKIRGMVNAFHHALHRSGDVGDNPGDTMPTSSCGEHTGKISAATTRTSQQVVTMSAGNAGKSFAYLAGSLGLDATVVMPDSVPSERQDALRALGATVETRPLSALQSRVEALVQDEGRIFVHPFDDSALIAGHASVGLEVLEDCADVDVVVVCCGGGGLVAGIAAAVKQLAHKYRSGNEQGIQVFAVEPTAAPTMAMSLAAGAPQTMDDFARTNPSGETHTFAHGLAAPYAGRICFEHVKKFVDGCVLVTDAELAAATKFMYQHGIVAETSGCAAVAAVMFDRIPIDLQSKKVACIVSGSNIQPQELQDVMQRA